LQDEWKRRMHKMKFKKILKELQARRYSISEKLFDRDRISKSTRKSVLTGSGTRQYAHMKKRTHG
jgi:hypothetical protein